MNTLSWIVDGSFSTRLTLALLHFLWQGCAGGLFVIVCGWLLRDAAARSRYALNVAILLLMAACLPATFFLLDIPANVINQPGSVETHESPVLTMSNEPPAVSASEHSLPSTSGTLRSDESSARPVSGTSTAPAVTEASVGNAPQGTWIHSLSSLLNTSTFATLARWVAAAYLTGVTLILGRLLRGVWGGARLRRLASTVRDPALLEMVRKQAARLGLKVAPTIAWCEQISVPVVVGIITPMILLPLAVASGLTPSQLQALLLHELSHIRRFDPVVNLLQRIVEAALFFHPVVWFVSRRISFERELAADDMVLAAGWDRPLYADALVRVAELAASITGTDTARRASVLGASGTNPSELKTRVLRLLGESPPPKLDVSYSAILTITFVAIMGGAFAWSQADRPVAKGNRAKPPDVIEATIAAPAAEQPAATVAEPPEENVAPRDDTTTFKRPPLVLPDHWIVTSVGFDNNDKELVTASIQGGTTIRRWDLVNKTLISEIKLEGDKHGRPLSEQTLRLSGDCQKVIAATAAYVGIWDTTTGKLLNKLPIPKIGDADTIGMLTCTPDLSVIAGNLTTRYSRLTLSYDAHTVIWTSPSDKAFRVLNHKGQNELIAMSLSTDGKRLATTNGSGACVWDTTTGQELLAVKNDNTGRQQADHEASNQFNNNVWSVQFSPDGKLFAMGDTFGVKLIDSTTGKLVRQLEGPYRYSSGRSPGLVFSKDGQMVARLGTAHKIEKATSPDIQLPTPLTPLITTKGTVGSTQYVIPIWSTQTGQTLFEIHTTSNAAAFGDDNQQLAVVFSDLQQALSVWHLHRGGTDPDQTEGPGPEPRQDKVEQNGHYRGTTAAEFIDQFKPTWSDAKLGIQYGIALTKQQRQYHRGERVPLVAFLRNASDKPLKVDSRPDYLGNSPKVIDAQGTAAVLENIPLVGHIPHYVETLQPGEAVGPFYFNVALGENPRPGKQHWYPCFKSPKPGVYNVTHSVTFNVGGPNNGDRSNSGEITSGQIDFEIVDRN